VGHAVHRLLSMVWQLLGASGEGRRRRMGGMKEEEACSASKRGSTESRSRRWTRRRVPPLNANTLTTSGVCDRSGPLTSM
jgi:hypothetical protein